MKRSSMFRTISPKNRQRIAEAVITFPLGAILSLLEPKRKESQVPKGPSQVNWKLDPRFELGRDDD